MNVYKGYMSCVCCVCAACVLRVCCVSAAYLCDWCAGLSSGYWLMNILVMNWHWLVLDGQEKGTHSHITLHLLCISTTPQHHAALRSITQYTLLHV